MTCTDDELIEHAVAIRDRAYAPYSKFRVGAAILDENDTVHVGCNVENAAYPLGSCAEASAISVMISKGGTTIKKIAIVGGSQKLESCAPCGGCRQAIAEFADDAAKIILKDETGAIRAHSVAELLPLAFRLTPK